MTDDSPRRDWRRQTALVHGGTRRSEFCETSEPIYMTSGYVYESAAEAEAAFANNGLRYVYSRYANPTVSMFEERLAALEGAEACQATASGMGAVFTALICQLRAGARVVASRALFGSCHYIINDILPRYGVESEFVDGADMDQWRTALAKPTQAVFLESPANPTLEVIDIAAVAELAHAAGARLVVDNVFSTPVRQKPLALGADVVVYSATKHIDGQGRALGGAILADRKFVDELLMPFIRHTGPSMSPMNAWILLKGLETLELRVERHCANALQVARFLEGQSKVTKVLYPGLPSHPQHNLAMSQMGDGGPLVTFEVAGGKAGAFRLLDHLGTILISNNLGDAKSLMTHPATTTHQRIGAEERERLGISDGMVRLSVGLEDCDDLCDDLGQALAAV